MYISNGERKGVIQNGYVEICIWNPGSDFMHWSDWGSRLVLYVPSAGSGYAAGNPGMGACSRREIVMSSSPSVYLNIRQITEVHHKDVLLKDVADIFCDNPALQNRCSAVKIRKIQKDKPKRYVETIVPVLEKLQKLDPNLQIHNLGETEFIIDYQPPKNPAWFWQWIKTIGVCLICFFGAAFAIMTFNNDVSVTAVFHEIYVLIMGREPGGFTVLELFYSIGLAIGIAVFFNHFAKWKLNTDPTPLEVEMRIYEDNISKTLIQNAERKEQDIDIY